MPCSAAFAQRYMDKGFAGYWWNRFEAELRFQDDARQHSAGATQHCGRACAVHLSGCIWCTETVVARVRIAPSPKPQRRFRDTVSMRGNHHSAAWPRSCKMTKVDNGVDDATPIEHPGQRRPLVHARADAVLLWPPALAMETTMNAGKVTLVSAGPGDLDLLTFRAAKAMAAADILLVDDLVNDEIATLAPRARVVKVGKRGGCKSTPQAFILRLMRRYASQGRHVVRVKGGDALLFGRAGEEITDLRRAGIEVDVVNGISSGFAAAAALGVSLTHRDHCQGVIFVTAHLRDGSEPDWAALAATGMTIAIYMGASRIEGICDALKTTLPADTPAAVVQWAGTTREKRVSATLDSLATRAAMENIASPAVILVGGAIGEGVVHAVSGADMQRLMSA